VHFRIQRTGDRSWLVKRLQRLRLADVRRPEMFRQVNVDILGVVETMSFFSCPHCKDDQTIWARGRAALSRIPMACRCSARLKSIRKLDRRRILAGLLHCGPDAPGGEPSITRSGRPPSPRA